MNKQKKVFCAMSGGVDSSVAALLLKQKGHNVTGVYMKGWSLTGCTEEDARDARRVAGVLNIPFYVFNFENEFKKEVVDYMVSEYAAGRTPNPDVMCNREIKFGLFLKKALTLGANYIATGHYVQLAQRVLRSTRSATQRVDLARPRLALRLRRNPARSAVDGLAEETRFALSQAKDFNKDQSYFLWTLNQDQLKHCLFPIGEYTKPRVRAIAKKYNLPTAEKPDSQGVCFVGEIDVAEFLKSKLGKNPGPILTLTGKKVGIHDGLSFYTIGQRRGIGSTGGGTPYYVVSKDAAKNALIVAEAENEALFSKELIVRDVNWISGKALKLPLQCLARIRYRQPLQKCKLLNVNRYTLKSVFELPQRAITPGQSAVFYAKDGIMLGGGVIV